MNADQKLEPRFLALRNDGLGARLRPLLNAIILSYECDGAFEFAWPDNPNSGSGSALSTAERIFDVQFLDHHLRNGWLDLFDCTSGSSLGQRQYVKHLLSKPGEILELVRTKSSDKSTHIMGFVDLRRILSKKPSENIYKKAFEEIKFSSSVSAAIELAYSEELPPNSTALHLRAGDIVDSHYRFSGRFTQWVLPLPLALELARAEERSDRSVIVFGQDAETIDYIITKTGALSSCKMALEHDLDATQTWFYESLLMSRCNKIIAGASSSFSQLPAQLGNVDIQNGYQLIDSSLALDALLSTETEGAPINDLQKSFSYWSISWIYSESISDVSRVFCLKRALEHDPINGLYALALASALKEIGQSDEANLTLEALVARDSNSPQWFPGCLRSVLNGLSDKRSSSIREFLLSNFAELAAAGSHPASLSIALTTNNKMVFQKMNEMILSSNWKYRDFYREALRRKRVELD